MFDLTPPNTSLVHSSCIGMLLIGMLLSSPVWPQDDLSNLPDPTRPDLGFNSTNGKTTGGLFNGLIGEPADEPPPPKLMLQYTLTSGKRRLAVINGETITEGESIADAKIMEVLPEQVVVRRQGKRITLDLARYQAKNEESEPDAEQAAGGNNDAPK